MYNVIILSWIDKSTGNVILLPVIVVGLTTPSWDMKVPSSAHQRDNARCCAPGQAPDQHEQDDFCLYYLLVVLRGQDRHVRFVPLRGLLFFLNTAHIEILFY